MGRGQAERGLRHSKLPWESTACRRKKDVSTACFVSCHLHGRVTLLPGISQPEPVLSAGTSVSVSVSVSVSSACACVCAPATAQHVTAWKTAWVPPATSSGGRLMRGRGLASGLAEVGVHEDSHDVWPAAGVVRESLANELARLVRYLGHIFSLGKRD